MGPLTGLRIVEMAGLGPAPFCGMLFADMGAEVIVVQRPGGNPGDAPETNAGSIGKSAIFNRGKKSIAIDLKKGQGKEIVKALLTDADGLIEGYRPGVMERLGLGPDECITLNRKLVYGRLTGWGQFGPLSQSAGHDINYIALSGALYYGGHDTETPTAPPTLVGDIGGGAMFLAVGMLAAILHARKSGQGQVIDAAITDGSALMCTLLHSLHNSDSWSDRRGRNLLDSAAHWYDSYLCADDQYISVGALEPKFYRLLIKKLGLEEDARYEQQFAREEWPELKREFSALFQTRTSDEWRALLEGTDCCFAPVLNFVDASQHPHNRARGNFLNIGGVEQAAPSPRFSDTPSEIRSAPPALGEHTRELLERAGYGGEEAEALIRDMVAIAE